MLPLIHNKLLLTETHRAYGTEYLKCSCRYTYLAWEINEKGNHSTFLLFSIRTYVLKFLSNRLVKTTKTKGFIKALGEKITSCFIFYNLFN